MPGFPGGGGGGGLPTDASKDSANEQLTNCKNNLNSAVAYMSGVESFFTNQNNTLAKEAARIRRKLVALEKEAVQLLNLVGKYPTVLRSRH